MSVGIRREDKNIFERRVPLTPESVRGLVENFGIEVVTQPSEIRTFPDEEYESVGAQVNDNLAACKTIFGVKEIPTQLLLPHKTYMYFAHVIKGQAYNMGMLRRLMELGCTLIDYEKVTDDKGRRLIFFGRHAGLAGMVDTLWSLGQRLDAEGVPNPFNQISPAWRYGNLEIIKETLALVRKRLLAGELPERLTPLAVGITGYGNVSQGAQEILDCLHPTHVEPGELARMVARGTYSRRTVYKIVYEERHLVEPLEPGASFDLHEYYSHPERYQSRFENYLPYLTILVNCIYWDARYPRLVTKEYLRRAQAEGTLRLKVVGDISCDVEGAVEATLKATNPANPTFVYDIQRDVAIDGFQGPGPVILAVDTLPCELPREASEHFSDLLEPYVPAIARADYTVPFEQLELPPEIKRAVVVYQGKLTPDYTYIHKHLEAASGVAGH